MLILLFINMNILLYTNTACLLTWVFYCILILLFINMSILLYTNIIVYYHAYFIVF